MAASTSTMTSTATTNRANSNTSTVSTSSISSLRRKVTPYRDNATDILPYSVTPSSPDFKEQLNHVVAEVCPFLRNQTTTIRALSGGLSNELFVVEAQDQPAVLVRIHPVVEEKHSIVDRTLENRVSAWLSQQKIGPIYYGRFVNGRVEQYYSHHDPLSHLDMPRLGGSHIAPIMAQLHSLRVPANVLEPADSQGDMFVRVTNWMQMAEQLIKDEKGQNPKAKEWLSKLQEEWAWLESILQAGPHDNLSAPRSTARRLFSQVVFTHMDMQSLNLLQDSRIQPPQLKVIDFEYSGFNPRGMDIANTFCEYCDMNDIKPRYELEYPSVQHQNEYISSYVKTLRTIANESVLEQAKEMVDNEEFLDQARKTIGQYSLVSHLSWSTWSIIQSQVSDIEFDYIDYLRCRMVGYDYMKGLFFS